MQRNIPRPSNEEEKKKNKQYYNLQHHAYFEA